MDGFVDEEVQKKMESGIFARILLFLPRLLDFLVFSAGNFPKKEKNKQTQHSCIHSNSSSTTFFIAAA